MEADFSGYATKAGLKCSDGRVIMPGAFRHQDQARVPLVWQHGHSDPENVLGHAILEEREDGVYAYGFFNDTSKAAHAKSLLEHKDISMLSIWANQLVERAGKVLHGAIREVSLVLSGANPGALIENVSIRHSDEMDEVLDDQAIIYTGLEFELSHSDLAEETIEETTEETMNKTETSEEETSEEEIGHAQEMTVQDVYDSMNQEQKDVLHYLIGQAIEDAQTDNLAQDNLQEDDVTKDDNEETKKGQGSEMKHNVFEEKDKSEGYTLSHDDIKGIVADATKNGSLKDAVENFALAHGIENIDVLFPDATAVDATPEYLQRRTEWVANWLGATRKSPFSRIKTFAADITVEEARAKGYIKGNLKKEEFFSVSKRVTTPTTVYKKQKLDRDDIVDITDFDVVAWLKGEMRLMLDEEIARASLIGDGRDIASDDKINEQNIRPIISDHELFVTTLTVNLTDSNSSIQEVIDAIVSNRSSYKGTPMPNFYTTETIIARFLLLKDTLGRRIYQNLADVAQELRVREIIPVEVMEEDSSIVGIMVNPVDYVYGATRGGEVSMFDDFDIDYNQHKYLIETRLCGALTKLKSAIVVKVTTAANSVTPNAPTFDSSTGVVTIVATTGVTYKNADTGATLSTGAQTALGEDETLNVRATPNSTYYIPDTEDAYWSFTRP